MGMGLRAPNTMVLPLCPYHHRNGGHGVAIHAGKKTWEEKFGTELELIQKVNQMLNVLFL